jgi:hypothetical protein
VPLNQALHIVEDGLKGSSPISLANAENSKLEPSLRESIRRAQCFNNAANPVVPVLVQDFSLEIAGSFSHTGSASGGAVTTLPTVDLTYGATIGKTQQLTVPLTFKSLSVLPNLYLAQNLDYLKSVPDEGRKAKLAERIMSTRDLLEKIIDEEVNRFTPYPPGEPTEECKRLEAGEGPFALTPL